MPVFDLTLRSDIANYNQQHELEGVVYTLEFRYNSRADAMYVNVLDSEGNILYGGLKLVSNWPINRVNPNVSAPPGAFLVLDPQDASAPILDDLQRNVSFHYVDSADVPSE